MSGYLWAALGILGSLAMTAVGDMVSEEVRDRLDRVPHAILRLAARKLSADERATVYQDEWLPELTYILKGAEARPISRLVTGIRYAIGIFVNTRRITRHLDRPAPGQPDLVTVTSAQGPRYRGSFLVGPQRLLLALSGAHAEILDLCPSERNKFLSLGWSVLITGSMAAASMWFGLASAMGINPVLALPVALVWGLVILGIDRWLVVSLPVGGYRRLAYAVPRLILAMLLGTVISTPLVLRVFQPEINNQIALIQESRAASFDVIERHSSLAVQVTQWEHTVSNLRKVIDSHGAVTIDPASDHTVRLLTLQLAAERAQQQKYYTQWTCQLYGGSQCPSKGDGALAQASQKSYQQAGARETALFAQIQARENQLSAYGIAAQQANYQQAKNDLPDAERNLTAVTAQQDTLEENFYAANEASNGVLLRLQALSDLSAGNPTVSYARVLLLLLFLVIECLPVTVKLLQRPGLYEEILSAVARREFTDALRRYHQDD